MNDLWLILRVLLLLGVANATPIIAMKLLKDRFSAPRDGGLKFFDGRPLFGSSKIWSLKSTPESMSSSTRDRPY